MELIVPKPQFDKNGDPFPTLGPQICDFMEERFHYGPGPLRGEPYVVRPDFRYLIYRAYEHYPEGYVLDYDGEIEDMSGRRHFNMVNLSLPKGSAKCLDHDTELVLESGEIVLAKNLKAGQSVMSYDQGEVVYRKVAAVEEQPVSRRFKVSTSRGREIIVSEGHPFLVSGTQWREGMPKYHKYTANDPKAGEESWSKVEDLRPGDRLVPALDWAPEGGDSALGWLLGVLQGDCTGDGRLSNADQEITDRVSDFFGLTTLAHAQDGQFYLRGVQPFLREHGLAGGNAYSKRVPNAVMTGGRETRLGFLAGLLDTDGSTINRSISATKWTRTIEWYSVSRDAMRDVQQILASVGINATLRKKMSAYKGEPFTSWTVVVSDKDQVRRLSETLPVVRERNVENFKVFRDLDAFGRFGDVLLDKVTSVEEIDQGTTIGVEIEGTHVHVTNGLVTHNTELMALISNVELHPDAPVRFNGYDKNAPGGLAPGRSVISPFIPLLAPTKDQLDDLAYGAAMVIASDMDPDKAIFDVTQDRIMVVGESESKIVPVAASAGRLDGLKPTFQGIDEPHRLFEDRHRAAYKTMVNNLPKRMTDDPWQLTCTTAGDPSEPSIARDHYYLGVKMAEGKVEEPTVFFYHRGTSDENAKFDTMGERLRALKEASGPEAAKFRNLRAVAAMWDDEGNDKSYLERVWCNRWVQASETAFDSEAFRELGDPSLRIPLGSTVTLGFDGAVTQDSTALVMTDVRTGIQSLVGLWERPVEAEKWQVPVAEVHSLVEACFEDYDVYHMYFDPPYWQEAGNVWAAKWEGRVIEWPTRNTNNIYYALRSYQEAIHKGDIGHDGNPDLVRHIGNAGRNELNITDDEGRKKFRLAKISRDRKYDAAMAAVLSWQARLDAIKKGAKVEEEYVSVPVRLR